MDEAETIKIESPNIGNSKFYILGGEDKQTDIPYAKVMVTPKSISFIEMIGGWDNAEDQANNFRELVERSINEAMKNMASSLVELFGEGTFLIAGQAQEQIAGEGADYAKIITDGFRIEINKAVDTMGFEVLLTTNVFAVARQGRISEIHINEDNVISTAERE